MMKHSDSGEASLFTVKRCRIDAGFANPSY
jgi:hypothetical protein